MDEARSLDALSRLSDLPRIGLPEVIAAAPALTRVDRKYLVSANVVARLVEQVPTSLRLLTIEDRLTTSYRSMYFDTGDLLTCRAHIQGRRLRWKARSRLYVEDGLCRLELKVRDGSGLTRKFFHPTESANYGRMDGAADAFFSEQLRSQGLSSVGALEPSVEVAYQRATLADPDSGARVTIDIGVRGSRHGRSVVVDPNRFIVETKGGRTPGHVDRILANLGARPVSFSKYAASASLMDPRIPDNDVRHMVGRELHLTSAGEAPTTASQISAETLRRTA